MSTIIVGATIPEGTFNYIPYAEELNDPAVCGFPGKITTSSWANKKIVLIGVPGAFTKTCSAFHIPPYADKYEELTTKGVDMIACIATNDLYVQSAWGRVMKVDDKIKMISDSEMVWLNKVGLVDDLSHVGFGLRSSRFAMIIDDLKVTYIGIETAPGVDVSGVEAVLKHLS